MLGIKNINESNQIINNFINDNKDGNKPIYNYIIKTLRFRIKVSIIISIILINNIYVSVNINKNVLFLKPFEKYVNACKQSRKMSRTKIFNDTPYISVCLAALNMKLYMEQNLLSIINQSFQDFEIIIVNDYSLDETEHIIRNLQSSDKRIKLVNHSENLGVYRSRIEAILNAKGEYILLMDPDDMLLNQNLFKELYNYNLNNNLDIVEFSVYQQKEGEKKIFLPDNHYETHYHGFPQEIISQPEYCFFSFFLLID